MPISEQSTSTVYLFKNCNITPDRNCIVDSIWDYLWTLNYLQIQNFQYIKPELNTVIRIDLAQANIKNFDSNSNYNYVAVYDTETANYIFYFIIEKHWKSINTVELVLSIDSLNTFSGKYAFSDKTKIIREHRNRWERADLDQELNYTNYDFSWVGNTASKLYTLPDDFYYATTVRPEIEMLTGTLVSHSEGITGDMIYFSIQTDSPSATFRVKYTIHGKSKTKKNRLIDFVPEGINPILYKETVGDIEQPDYNYSWYLVYRNHTTDENSSVDCFICADDRIYIENGPASTIIPNRLDDNLIYYSAHSVRDITFLDNHGNSARSEQLASNIQSVVIFRKAANDKILWANIPYQTDTTPNATWPSEAGWTEADYLVVDNVAEVRASRYEIIRYVNISNNIYTDVVTIATDGYVQINSINNINRTDPQLIKIIKLPYCPVASNILINNSEAHYSYDFTILEYSDAMNMLKLKDLSIKFLNSFTSSLNPYSVLSKSFTPSITHIRNDDYESKLYNSEFYTPKFVYDSFNFPYQLERLSNIPSSYNINFKPTSTINSKFLFEFPNYNIDGKSTEDYDNIVAISRNNEETLYNSSYINYVKNGYNYDVKAKNLQATKSYIFSAVQIAGAIASFAGSFGTGGASVSAGITLINSAITTITGNIANTVQSEQNIEQKLAEYKNQATSVSGADDVDLMSYYSNNRAKLVNYRCSNNLKEQVGDLFYYCGYARNIQAMPNTTSRKWFNYIQCNPIFDLCYIPENYQADVKQKYSAGVTVYHKVNNTWDWSQTHENWETELF